MYSYFFSIFLGKMTILPLRSLTFKQSTKKFYLNGVMIALPFKLFYYQIVKKFASVYMLLRNFFSIFKLDKKNISKLEIDFGLSDG